MGYIRECRRLMEALGRFEAVVNKEIRMMNDKLKVAPKGSLRVSRNGRGNINYYHYNEDAGTDIYIKKKEIDNARILAQKDYFLKTTEILEKQHDMSCKLLESLKIGDVIKKYEKLNPNRKSLVKPIDLSDEEYINEWQSHCSNLQNTYEIYGDFYTMKGEHVRSKSEKIIADSLYAHKIPYKYEDGMILASGEVVFPDFRALNVRMRKELVIEHFGKMGDLNYTTDALRKIDRYAANGYWPGDNLLLTFEGGEKSLNSLMVDKMIEKFLM